jgi:transposase
MDDNTKQQPKDWREARRTQAWKLHQKNWAQKDIAEALGVTAGSVSQWLKRGREEGPEALRSRRGGGPKPRLSHDQLAELKEHLAKGAEHFGFRGAVWPQPRVAQLIKRESGVSYHPSHVGRILKQMGWSRQKPITRASQRNEAAIERWRTAKWVELEKKPSAKDAP